jgi:non-heme chloroperoxidase
MNNISIGDICDSYERIIRALPLPPIIMGYSFGGLFVQILLSRGLGSSGVSICPGTPAGIFALPLTTIKLTFSVLSKISKRNETVPIGEHDFHYAFGNLLSAEEFKILWNTYSIPANATVLWQGALVGVHKDGDAKVDFA